MVKIKTTRDSPCLRGDGTKGTHLHCWWSANFYSDFGNQCGGFSDNW